MTSSDDPDRDRRTNPQKISTAARRKIKTRVCATWSHAARREYSALEEYSATDTATSDAVPVTAALSRVAKKASRATLEYLAAHTKALETFGSTTNFAIDISFVSDVEIQELNASYRGKNKPTDVLSFAQTEGEAFPVLEGFGAQDSGSENFSSEVLLGDVILAIGTSHRQALELKHSLQREIAFLTVHGTLHLCGYDHDTSSRRKTMWKLQDAIVELLPIELPPVELPPVDLGQKATPLAPDSSSCSSR